MIGRERAQALVEAVLVLPVCMTAALTIVECGVLVRDRIAVTDAATRAAHAELIGADADGAARAALPKALRSDADIAVDANRVHVTIHSRTRIPGVTRIAQRSAAVFNVEEAR